MSGTAEADPSETAGDVVFTNVRVFDGRQVLHGTDTVRVAGGLITELGCEGRGRPGEQVVDGSGATLLPGLIDAHTHVSAGRLEQALVLGVTTELDMFADPAVAADYRVRAAGDASVADLRSAGTGATVAGGHPTQLVDRGFYRPFPLLENSTDPQRFVADRQAEGSDYLKVFIDDGSVVGFPHPSLRLDQVKALVDAAHRRGMLAVAHVATCADVVTAVNAGVDVLGHVPTDNPLPDQMVDQIAALSIAVIPTLGVNRAVCGCGDGPQVAADPHLQPYLDQTSVMMLTMMGGNFPIGSAAKLRPDPDVAPASVRSLHERGVTLLAGSDAGTLGVAHGATLHDEVRLLVEAGLTQSDALAAATLNPASVFTLPDRGSIIVGASADLVLVDGDPTTDIAATRNIAGVWRGGQRATRARYDR